MPRGEGSDTSERIARLSERFKTHAVGRRSDNTRTRERQSLYLDTEVVARANTAYRDLAHALHPQTVSKSAFWEAALEYALAHLDELQAILAERAESVQNGERASR
jgi:hypothetical protein